MDNWRIRDDARTLLEAEKIKSDLSRHTKAQKMAVTMSEEAVKELEAAKGLDLYPSMTEAGIS